MEKRITQIEVTKEVLYTIPSRVRGEKCIEISFLASVDKDGVGDETEIYISDEPIALPTAQLPQFAEVIRMFLLESEVMGDYATCKHSRAISYELPAVDETSDPPMYTFELHFPGAGLIDERVTLLVGDRENEINRSQMEDFACALCTFAVDVL